MDRDNNIEKARELYLQGQQAWKDGQKARAMTLFGESVALDPEGPGKTALEMCRKIMSFFDPNQLNP